MYRFKNIFAIIVVLLVAVSCEKEIDNLDNIDDLGAPSNITASFDIATDNSGLVTITPQAQGVTGYEVKFGDTIPETPVEYGLDEKITHIYEEGVYTFEIKGLGLNGLTSTFEQELNVTFRAPEDLEIAIENSLEVSKQVNITATAVYAAVMEYSFGEFVDETPAQGLPGETVSYVYDEPGDYDITVVAKSGGAATLDSTFTFTVTRITGPQEAAPTPPGRLEEDVISVYSGAYENLSNTDFTPDWGQSTQVSFMEVGGDSLIKYADLNYQGTQFENPIDASGMEYIHLDMWTDDALEVNFYLISTGPAETPYALEITAGEWVSYDIPLSEFTDVVDVSDIIQFKFDGTEGSSLYLDNLYFYREGETSEISLPLDFESSTIEYEWVDFDGGEVTIIDNPHQSGINTSNKVAQMIKGPGQSWGGSYIALDNPIDFSENKTFNMKVWSPREDAAVLLKVENMDDQGVFYEAEVNTTVANEWENLTFDYSGIDDGQSYQKIVIIFENGTEGDGSSDFTFFFDDIELTN